MLYPTAGSRLYIADAPAEMPRALPASGWVEIGETEAFGMLGVEWETTEAVYANCGQGDAQLLTDKIFERRPPVQVVLGNDPEDEGQLLLWQALRSRAHFPFRLVFPNGTTTRGWFALVVGLSEVFDTANSVMKLQASLLPTSPIYRNGVI